MVPIWGGGWGSALVGRAVYLASMASVGRKEVFIFLRLGGASVRRYSLTGACDSIGFGGLTQAHRWGQRNLCGNHRERS